MNGDYIGGENGMRRELIGKDEWIWGGEWGGCGRFGGLGDV